jgi:hypothetical protein
MILLTALLVMVAWRGDEEGASRYLEQCKVVQSNKVVRGVVKNMRPLMVDTNEPNCRSKVLRSVTFSTNGKLVAGVSTAGWR